MGWTKLEKRLAWLWLVSAVWTTICFVAVDLSSSISFFLALTIIGIPLAFLLVLLPTALLYLTGAAPVYLLLRKRSRALGAIVSIAIVGSAGIAIPAFANRQLASRVEAVTRHDGGGPVEAPKGSVLAYLSAYQPDDDVKCEEFCQRLLFSGVARAVIRGNVDALSGKPTMLQRFEFGPAKGPCRPASMTPARATEQDVGHYFPPPFLQQKTQQAYGDGLCFFQTEATLDEADLILARDDFAEQQIYGNRGQKIDLRLFRMQHQRWAATYERSGTTRRQVMRVSHAVAPRVASPLRLSAPVSFNGFTPAEWGTDGTIEKGRWIEVGLHEFLSNDLRVQGLTTETGEALPRTSGR